jgi:hypothetical protein
MRRHTSGPPVSDPQVVSLSDDQSMCVIRFDSGKESAMAVSDVKRDLRIHRGRHVTVHRIHDVHVGLRVFHPDEHGVPLPEFVRALGGEPQSRCRCGRGEPQSRCRCGSGEPQHPARSRTRRPRSTASAPEIGSSPPASSLGLACR